MSGVVVVSSDITSPFSSPGLPLSFPFQVRCFSFVFLMRSLATLRIFSLRLSLNLCLAAMCLCLCVCVCDTVMMALFSLASISEGHRVDGGLIRAPVSSRLCAYAYELSRLRSTMTVLFFAIHGQIASGCSALAYPVGGPSGSVHTNLWLTS